MYTNILFIAHHICCFTRCYWCVHFHGWLITKTLLACYDMPPIRSKCIDGQLLMLLTAWVCAWCWGRDEKWQHKFMLVEKCLCHRLVAWGIAWLYRNVFVFFLFWLLSFGHVIVKEFKRCVLTSYFVEPSSVVIHCMILCCLHMNRRDISNCCRN